MKIKERYEINKAAAVGEFCFCPSCGTVFLKTTRTQAFCTSKGGTKCKDKYWNTVTPEKRCNTTRISPANAAWMERNGKIEDADEYRLGRDNFNPDDFEHPFSSEALGQN